MKLNNYTNSHKKTERPWGMDSLKNFISVPCRADFNIHIYLLLLENKRRIEKNLKKKSKKKKKIMDLTASFFYINWEWILTLVYVEVEVYYNGKVEERLITFCCLCIYHTTLHVQFESLPSVISDSTNSLFLVVFV